MTGNWVRAQEDEIIQELQAVMDKAVNLAS